MQWGAAADRDVVGEVPRPTRAKLAPQSKATPTEPPTVDCSAPSLHGPLRDYPTFRGKFPLSRGKIRTSYCHLRGPVPGVEGGSHTHLQSRPGAQYWEVMDIEFSSTWMEVREGAGSARREAVGAGRRVTRQDTNEKQPGLSSPEAGQSLTP